MPALCLCGLLAQRRRGPARPRAYALCRLTSCSSVHFRRSRCAPLAHLLPWSWKRVSTAGPAWMRHIEEELRRADCRTISQWPTLLSSRRMAGASCNCRSVGLWCSRCNIRRRRKASGYSPSATGRKANIHSASLHLFHRPSPWPFTRRAFLWMTGIPPGSAQSSRKRSRRRVPANQSSSSSPVLPWRTQPAKFAKEEL